VNRDFETRLGKLESTSRGRRRKRAVWLPAGATEPDHLPEINDGDEVLYISWGHPIEQDDLR
jgi:hypothetical protein